MAHLRVIIGGLSLGDFKCPICKKPAIKRLKKDWIICPVHGLIEANIMISLPPEAA